MRLKMVEYQIESRGVRDQRVLESHERGATTFICSGGSARPGRIMMNLYPLESGQTISQPYIVAYMTQNSLQLQGKERYWKIGTGSGYQAAILQNWWTPFITIEIVPELSRQAQQVLKKAAIPTFSFMIGNGYYGWPENAPF